MKIEISISVKVILLLLFLLPGNTPLLAQEGNLKSCLVKTRLFVNLYNNHQFKQIHSLLDSAQAASFPQDQFVAYLDTGLFQPYGKILGFEHLDQNKNYQDFFLLFTHKRMHMYIALDPADKISLLRFSAYEDKLRPTRDSLLHDNPLRTGLDSLVHNLAAEYLLLPQTCGLGIGIITPEGSFVYNYGETARGSMHLPDKKSIYEAGSISKTFTALLFAKAILDKKIDPEQDIRHYLQGTYPDLEFNRHAIRVKHLLNHTSGLPLVPSNLRSQPDFDSLNPYQNYTKNMLFQDLSHVDLNREPGSYCAYSNYNYALLGQIAESVYKKPFEDILAEEILRDLNLNNTGMKLDPVQEQKYLQGYSESTAPAKHWNLGVFAPAGGLKTSVEDMLLYLSMQLDADNPQARKVQELTFDANEKIAMSWWIRSDRYKADLYWHNGATLGFSSFCGFMPAKKLAIVLLSNSAASTDHLAIQILKYLSNHQ
ncbi:MAG TPA: serine hydrolase domain-containing protein [Bacteroidia bacterium]|nr:serine hydrolase domain-containing protein [Bacteroidia bacterium]